MRAIGWLLLAGACCQAQAQPDVREILGRVAEKYRNLAFYHFKVTEYPYRQLVYEFPLLASKKDDSYVMDFAGALPGKFAMRTQWGTQCLTDGHLTWRYSAWLRSNVYTEAIAKPYDPAAPDPDVPPVTQIERDAAACEREIVVARELFVDRWTRAADWAPRSTISGEGSLSVAGVKHRCWIVDADPFEGAHSTLWIDQATFLVLRESFQDANKKVLKRNWILAEVAKPPDPKTFVFQSRWLTKRSEPGEILVGKPAPDFSFTTAEGKQTSVRALKGNIVVVYFWATWTRDAAKQMKEASDWWHTYRQSGVTVIGVSYRGEHESQRDVERFLAKNAIEFPNYVDASAEVHKAYLADLLPTVVIVDAEGLIYQHLRNDGEVDHWASAALGIP